MDRTLDILDRLDLQWEIVTKWSGPIWTGDRFIFADNTAGEVWQFHEFCHWMVADDLERKQPDFGLGQNVDSLAGWRSSKWRQPPAEPGHEVGLTPSWSSEERVAVADSAMRESYAVWAIGLFSLIYPEAEAETFKTMEDFGAWNESLGKNPAWTDHDTAEIAKLACPVLDLNETATIAHLETLRGTRCPT